MSSTSKPALGGLSRINKLHTKSDNKETHVTQ